jgi:hypothetical protein
VGRGCSRLYCMLQWLLCEGVGDSRLLLLIIIVLECECTAVSMKNEGA